MTAPAANGSLGALLGDLARSVSLLVRDEVALARTELTEKLATARTGAVAVGLGAAVIVIGLQFMLAAGVIALASEIGWWQSALVVGVAVLLAGALMAMVGLSRLRGEQLAPRRTLASLKQTGVWTRERLQ